MKANVSGHSGLPEHVELKMLEDKMTEQKEKYNSLNQDILDLMTKHGIAPHERKKALIRFAKWLEEYK